MKSPMCFIFCAGVILMWNAGLLTAQPINPNGGFENATPGVKTGGDVAGWTFLVAAPAKATFEIVEMGDEEEVKYGKYALRVDMMNVGANAWDVQAVNSPFTVVPGVEYTVSVWARADYDGLVANFTVGSPTYAEWGRAHQVVMSMEWKEITFRFTAPVGATEGRAPIHFSEAANSKLLPAAFYLDSLCIKSQATGVVQNIQIPYRFELGQNYPNPFNPTTTIGYHVPSLAGREGRLSDSGFVTLKVYDLLGREVATLVNRHQPEGLYEVKFDAGHLTSGIYHYTLKVGNLAATKQMTLIR